MTLREERVEAALMMSVEEGVPGHIQGRESILSKGDTTTLINLKSQQFVLKLLCDFFSVLEDALSQG